MRALSSCTRRYKKKTLKASRTKHHRPQQFHMGIITGGKKKKSKQFKRVAHSLRWQIGIFSVIFIAHETNYIHFGTINAMDPIGNIYSNVLK